MKSVKRKDWKPSNKNAQVVSRHDARFLLLLMAVICVDSCVSKVGFMTLSNAASLRKGMSIAESKSVLPQLPQYEFSLDSIHEDEPVLVDAYYVVSGDYVAQYILAFSKDRLLYWGYPHEFARSKDAFINTIGEQAVIKLKQLEYEEAQKRQKERAQEKQDNQRSGR
jgi:hypothetical protein